MFLDVHGNGDIIRQTVQSFNPKTYAYPVDGLIMEYDDLHYGASLGATGHHENRLIALKWADELYETKFINLDVAVTRTGMVSLTGIFEPVTIDGTQVSRAYLHNYDIYKNLALGKGSPYMKCHGTALDESGAIRVSCDMDKIFNISSKQGSEPCV